MAELADRLGPQAINLGERGSRRWLDVQRAIDWIREWRVYDAIESGELTGGCIGDS